MAHTLLCFTPLFALLLTLGICKSTTYATTKLLESIEALGIVDTYARLLQTLVLAIAVDGLREALKAEGTVGINEPCNESLRNKVRGILRGLT